MAITGPFLIGSVFGRNQAANTPMSFNTLQAVPVGSLLFGLWGTDAPDTADCQMSDAAGNSWSRQVQSMDPNNTGFMTNLFVCQPTTQINQGQSISMLCTVRASYGGPVYMFSGAQGSLTGMLVKWSSEWAVTPLAPNGAVNARLGQSVFAVLAVAGPNNDVYTPDANFSADQKVSASNFNATIHACARHNIPSSGAGIVPAIGVDDASIRGVTFAPTLGSARQGAMALVAFG